MDCDVMSVHYIVASAEFYIRYNTIRYDTIWSFTAG